MKRRLLGTRNHTGNSAENRINKAKKEIRLIERELVRVDEAAALLETNRLLKKIGEDLYPKIFSNIKAEKEKWELALR